MGKLLLLSIMFCSNTYVFAQTVWKGLRLGMSVEEAQKQYRGTLRKETKENVGTWLVDDNAELLGDPVTLRATASFFFDINGLKSINIVAANNPLEGRTESGGLTLSAISSLKEKLSEKYGKPVFEDGQCNPTAGLIIREANMPISCKQRWKAEGLTIKADWTILNKQLFNYWLTYERGASNDF